MDSSHPFVVRYSIDRGGNDELSMNSVFQYYTKTTMARKSCCTL